LPALACLLLVAVFIGIGATTPAASDSGAWGKHGTLVGLATEVPLALLFVVVWVIGKRSVRQGFLARAMRTMLERIIVVAMIVIVLLVFINSLHPHPRKAPNPSQSFLPKHSRAQPKYGKPGSQATVHLPWLPYLLLGLLVAMVVVACVVLILRRRQYRVPGFHDMSPDEGEELQRAVESGRSALRTVDNARAAIIACYLAMESSLAGAGTERGAAETPDELLDRAAAAGLVHGGAAGRLTALFYEARYSTHPMPPSARESAREALDELSADLTIEMAVR
jgi:hypothetical protein